MENEKTQDVKITEAMTLIEQTLEQLPEGSIVLMGKVGEKRMVILSGAKTPETAIMVIERICRTAIRGIEKMKAGK